MCVLKLALFNKPGKPHTLFFSQRIIIFQYFVYYIETYWEGMRKTNYILSNLKFALVKIVDEILLVRNKNNVTILTLVNCSKSFGRLDLNVPIAFSHDAKKSNHCDLNYSWFVVKGKSLFSILTKILSHKIPSVKECFSQLCADKIEIYYSFRSREVNNLLR